MAIEVNAVGRLKEFNRAYLPVTTFVVTDKNKKLDALVFEDNGTNNSDRVRSAFAKANKIKFVDVRCSRLKNYKD